MTNKLTPFQVVRDSLRHHRRIHVAVALGTAAATAVLTGALLVGDSVRGSLRATALDRLGGVESILASDKLFRAELGDELNSSDEIRSRFEGVDAGLVLEGSVTAPEKKTNASHVTLLAIHHIDGHLAFTSVPNWRTQIQLAKVYSILDDDEIALNEPLAEELGVGKGDVVIVRLPAAREVPEESPLGRKTDTIANSSRLKVKLVVAAKGFGGFSIRPNQQATKNAYLTPNALGKILGKPGRANSLLVFEMPRKGDDIATLKQNEAALRTHFHPKLADYGLKWSETKPGYFNLTTDRMLFDPATEAAALAAYQDYDPQPVFTYLANTIAAGDKQIPYSTIAALDMSDVAPLGPFKTPEGKAIPRIADDEILLNRWAAEDLGVQPGAMIRIAYFEPESTHAEVKEAEATFKLAAIVDLKEKDDPYLTPDLTPELPGVTDQLKMGDWDPPFPYDGKRVRDKDEKYWDDYKATPKAFVSYATGRKLWGSRFGDMTSLRVPPRPDLTIESLAAKFQPDPASLGFAFQPVKLKALEASSGTTPFEGLFLGFSFFIIAAAVMLTLLLFKLGVEQRAAEVGLMLALGLGLQRVSRMLLVEGTIVAAVGAAIGTAVGVGYAWLMLAGLRTLWLDAVTVPFLTLFVTPKSLAVGYVAGVVVSILAIWWALRSLRRLSVRRLLSNQAAESDLVPQAASTAESRRPRRSIGALVQWGSLLLAVVVGATAMKLKDEAQAGAFFGSAALVLTGLLTMLRRKLAAARFGSLVNPGSGRVALLAVRNAGRNPGRSTLTIGLVAAAAFLIVGVSAFRIAPPSSYVEKSSGTGGFALVAQSDLSILPDLNTEDGRLDLNFSQAARKQLVGTTTYAFRFKPGDDASCLNLYQTSQPKILGATEKFIERGGFAWADNAASTDAEKADPWLLLRPASNDAKAEVPVVIDQATSMYSLHLSGVGATYDVVNSRNETVRLKVVGLLKNSILQGSLVIHESAFKQHFPEVGGYRYFLIEASPEQEQAVSRALESTLADFGFDAQRTDKLLAGFLAVQNTYLSTFQSLGGLGLLLGTFGLAVVQLRNVLERRGELALLRAVGLSKALLGRLVFWENLALLVGGLGCGTIAAAVAVLPHALLGGAGVPWLSLAGTLGVVLVVGLLAGAFVVRSVLRMPLLQTLRGE
ncbi:MAG: FtsX-like permease family protein [Planctomycetaceae bacterium]|nr:FtsX-like permease family protein [Planctomycetaceae bacterium]